MEARYRGTFVISWAQAFIDGTPAGPAEMPAVGAKWRWTGRVLRLDAPDAALILDRPAGEADIRGRIARAARRRFGIRVPSTEPAPVGEGAFVVSDGETEYQVLPIDTGGRKGGILAFPGALPPSDTELTVVARADQRPALSRRAGGDAGLICFTPGTLVDTPDGPRPIEHIRPGDFVLTRDSGPQPVRWVGSRRISGARLFATPELRPVRIRAGAFDTDRPVADLVVSPRHRILLRGAAARLLFNEAEVLVAAADLVNDRSVLIDHSLRETTYLHLLLDRHEIIRANGIEAESFLPDEAAMAALDPSARDSLLSEVSGLAEGEDVCGGPARRCLSRPEAALLLYDGRLSA